MNTDTQYATQQFDEVLESAQNQPDVSHIFEALEGKTPEECVVIARETLYEGVTPLLRTSTEAGPIAEFHAIMEVTWQKLQELQANKGRGLRARSGSSS